MSHYASGRWTVADGLAEAFEDRWREFLEWTRETHPGLDHAMLLAASDGSGRYVSLAAWDTADARAAWKQSEGFVKRLGACRELCDDFVGGDFQLAVAV